MWISKRKWNEMEEKIKMLDSSLSLICDTAWDALYRDWETDRKSVV